MSDQIIKALSEPSFIIALLVAVAVFATVFTLLPALGGNELKARMKSVAIERDELRARERAADAGGIEQRATRGCENISPPAFGRSSNVSTCVGRWSMKARCKNSEWPGFEAKTR